MHYGEAGCLPRLLRLRLNLIRRALQLFLGQARIFDRPERDRQVRRELPLNAGGDLWVVFATFGNSNRFLVSVLLAGLVFGSIIILLN